jgi:cytoskeletal protein CcmA (bactofilin family)
MGLFNKEPEKIQKVQPVQPSSVTSSQPQPGDLVAEGPASLGRGTKVSGKLAFGGSARIDGEVDGEIAAKDRLHIGANAVITAQIKAASIVVAGKVTGDIIGSKKIEIRPSGKVTGDLSAPVVVIQEGARFEGRCSMPGAVGEGERVTVFPKQERVVQIAQAVSVGVQGPVPVRNSKASAS